MYEYKIEQKCCHISLFRLEKKESVVITITTRKKKSSNFDFAFKNHGKQSQPARRNHCPTVYEERYDLVSFWMECLGQGWSKALNNFDVALLGLKRKAEENKEPDRDNKIEQKKRTRISYTKEQLLHLESLFGENNCPDLFKREEIAELS